MCYNSINKAKPDIKHVITTRLFKGGGLMKKSSNNDKLIINTFVFGVPIYLLMEHPNIFWFVFVPIVAFLITGFIRWIKK